MPLRIAIDIRHLRDFGFGTYIRNLIRALARVDHENQYVLISGDGGQPELGDLPPNFQVTLHRRQDTERLDNLLFPWFLHHLRADLCHVPLNRIPFLMPRPYVVTVHDLSSILYNDLEGLKKAMLERKVRRGLLRAERVIAVSEATARDAEAILGVSRDRIRQIYNAPDSAFLERLRPVTEEERREWNKRKRMILERYQIKHPFLLYAGSIRPHKNLPRLVEAFALVREDLREHPVYRDLRLIIIGDELSRFPYVRQAVVKTRMQNVVRFLGFVEQETMRALYEAAAAFVFPSLYEGFGFAPLEAMACGTPVVGSNVSSLPEAVGDAAVFVNPESVFDIARGIGEVLVDDHLRTEMIRRGYQQVKRFHWDRTAAQTIQVYQEVGGRQAGSGVAAQPAPGARQPV